MKKKQKAKKEEIRRGKIEHFQQRCMERVGFIIHQKYLKEIKGSSTCKFLEQANGKTYFRLRYDNSGRSFVVVYDQPYDLFVTIMYYEEWMKNKRPELNIAIKHPEYIK